ncbi:hypothetical protein DOC35_19550 [Salmonella enterica subsp. enterica]|nr:hypothetical protein [Salmonella enterica subsp. enterica]
MSKAKAGKLLAKALDNSSKEEATTAFGMAFSYAERAGIRLSSIHRVEVVEVKGGSISPDRERELVDKYNRTLKRAKDLTEQLARAERKAENYLDKAAAAKVEADELRAQLAAGGITTSMQELMDAAKELSAHTKRLQGELTEANSETVRAWKCYSEAETGREDAIAEIARLQEQVKKARGDGGYQLRIDKARAEERERATYAELVQTRKERDTERQGRLNAEADKADLSVKCIELDEMYSAAAIRRNNLSREAQQLRDTVLQMEKDKQELREALSEMSNKFVTTYEDWMKEEEKTKKLEKENEELKRQLDTAREATRVNANNAQELADTLKELIDARGVISEQAEEIDALRSTRRALQIELDKHTENPLKKLFGW